MRSAIVSMLLTSFAAVSGVAHAGTAPRIAISGIAAAGELMAVREAVAAEVRTSIETAAVFRVVRADVVQAMQSVSPSSACPQQRCAQRLGRLVQADYVVFGELAKAGELVAVALRIVDARDGTISHRLAFDVSPKRDELARDIDAGVRSMLGLGVRKPQSSNGDADDVELATMPQVRGVIARQGGAKGAVPDYANRQNHDIEVWRARHAALN